MIQIDGSFGEGGGQILRTSVALSMVTGYPVEIKNIRAKRKKPGLQNQHLTAIKAASQVCAAEVSGLTVGSDHIVFSPNEINSGNYYFDIGTAGSTTLVLQTVLYALMTKNEPSRIRIKGGTHNPFAPTADFIKKTFLPCLEKFGLKTKFKLEQYGFYPRGGGVIEVEVIPKASENLSEVDLSEEPEALNLSASVILSRLPDHIAKRELKVLTNCIKSISKTSIINVENSLSPANVVTLFAKSDNLTETFSQLGKKGVKAEEVAQLAAKEFTSYKKAKALVGEYLSDQILLPMALSGKGKFLTVKPSSHTITNIYTIKNFLDVNISYDELKDGQYLIKVGQ